MTTLSVRESVPSILGQRYASTPMLEIFSPRNKIILERRLWVAAMKVKRNMGISIEDETIAAYERVIEHIDFDRIRTLELQLNHDVVARKRAFDELAGYTLAHKDFTSRDLTENIEQMQIFEATGLIAARAAATLFRIGKRIREWEELDTCGRSHNMPGQVTTLGKRFSMWADELYSGLSHIDYVIINYRFRGFTGAMGTAQDIGNMFEESDAIADNVTEFNRQMSREIGLGNLFDSTGQVYPRSFDFMVVSALCVLAMPISSMATTLRLMAGNKLLNEGFKPGRKGSSAMPHKVNPSRCERIIGLRRELGGCLAAAHANGGEQWYEGDVSCSVVRRASIADAFYAIDGILETAMTILDEMNIFPRMIERELEEELPFLNTTRLRQAAVAKGMDDNEVYEKIQEHTKAAVDDIVNGRGNTLVERIDGDAETFPFTTPEIRELLLDPDHGNATHQTDKVAAKLDSLAIEYPGSATYMPEPLL